MPAIDRLLNRAKEPGVSDLHLAEGQPPWLRRNGHLAALPGEPALAGDGLSALLKEIAPAATWARLERTGESTFAYSPDGHQRFRVNCYRQAAGRGAVCRAIPAAPPALADLGLAPVLHDLARLHAGLVVIAGPTGSGVSTTVAAVLHEIATTQSRRILTLEDPIEFVLASGRSTVVQREIGPHARTSAAALHDAARAGFDVAFVGELHSRETIAQALTTAESGVLVFATLRASSVVRALDQVVGAFPDEARQWVRTMLANALRSVCVQFLVAKADGSGRCAVSEVLTGTPGVGSAIREGYNSKLGTMMQSGAADGMITLDDSLRKKAEAKVITPAEAAARAQDKARFQEMVPQQDAAAGAAPGAQPAAVKPSAPPPMAGRTQFVPRKPGT
jgi:twitching motility protein PilT